MSKQIVSINHDDGRVEINTYTDEEFDSSGGTVDKRHHATQVQIFEVMLGELQRLVNDDIGDYRRKHASEFIRTHGVWLHNLAKTGFAIDYTQYVRG